MITKWTSHLSDPEEKERFRQEVLNARPVLERLAQILDEDEKELERVESSSKQFDNPNWAFKQAFNIGGKASYSVVKRIIDLETPIQEQTNDRQFTRPRPE